MKLVFGLTTISIVMLRSNRLSEIASFFVIVLLSFVIQMCFNAQQDDTLESFG